jgi:microcystin-dependent protein
VGRPTGEWEIGRCGYRFPNSQPAIDRALVIASSNGGAAVNFSPGLKQVSLSVLSPSTEQLKADWQEALGMDTTGMCAHFAQATPPAGWLKRNGAAVSRTTYARLFAKIGTTYGAGDGSTTFNVPDARGAFDRGLDEGRGVDPSRTLGSWQGSANAWHAHGVNDPSHAHSVYDPSHAHGVADPGHGHGAWTDSQGHHDHASGWNANNGGAYGLQFGSAAYSGSIAIWGADGGRRTDAGGSHGHNVGIGGSGTGIWIYGAGTGISIYGAGTGISIVGDGANESRPANVAYLACIKY